MQISQKFESISRQEITSIDGGIWPVIAGFVARRVIMGAITAAATYDATSVPLFPNGDPRK